MRSSTRLSGGTTKGSSCPAIKATTVRCPGEVSSVARTPMSSLRRTLIC